jgi:hypothetical protein
MNGVDQRNIRGLCGTIICRVIVPMWIGVGMYRKLLDFSPLILPRWISEVGSSIAGHVGGVTPTDVLTMLLYAILIVEGSAVVTMIFVSYLARPVAILMLTLFCGALAVEWMRHGEGSCGCFGTTQLSINHVLLADGVLLILAVLFNPGHYDSSGVRESVIGMTSVAALVGATMVPNHAWISQVRSSGSVDGQSEVGKLFSQPREWYWPGVDRWVGKRWNELDVADLVSDELADWNEGVRLIVFHRADCVECKQLQDKVFRQSAPYPTTFVLVPSSSGGNQLPYTPPCSNCVYVGVKRGPKWIIQTPLIVRLVDGIVVCTSNGGSGEVSCLE